ncbi:MAG: sodium:proton antiporter [Sorangiineae bacterium NIC37A_2]|nr:MAG: sodium:proton antiporter [Sorangiineae bacterium NIC37A_2]
MDHAPVSYSPVAVLPFATLLLCIAALPLIFHHFWESNRNKGIITAILAAPVAVWLASHDPHALEHSAIEYVSFICLLGSLFVVSGGIHVSGDLEATPKVNAVLLGIGAVLANFIGTTGASMVLIRLVLRTNSERKNTSHIPFFFILLVSNCGGLLTPLGDPPLFLGYLRGVPFFWTLNLLPVWLLAVSYLLTLFVIVDRRAYAAEPASAIAEDVSHVEPVRVTGLMNIALLLGIVLAVFLPTPYRELVMVALTVVSLVFGSKEARQKNDFSFGPILEVAILFAGIFVTMVPALALLKEHGSSLGLVSPWHYFVVTGALSSVLDNAPTYLTFLSAAQGLGLPAEVVGVPQIHLFAISAASVLMGANTYIGNGPNFMVKAIADSQAYETDNFVSYAIKAIFALTPIYLVITIYLAMAA